MFEGKGSWLSLSVALTAIFQLVPTKTKPCSFPLKGNATHMHRLLLAHVFESSLPTQDLGVAHVTQEAGTLVVPIWGMKRLRCFKEVPQRHAVWSSTEVPQSQCAWQLLLLSPLSPWWGFHYSEWANILIGNTGFCLPGTLTRHMLFLDGVERPVNFPQQYVLVSSSMHLPACPWNK